MCKAPSVPPEPSASSDPDRVAVGFDATPLLGRPTGVGVFCSGALSGLSGLSSVSVSAFAVSWRRRHGIAPLLPDGISHRQRAMPARPLHAAWAHTSLPPVEWFIGRQDVVHGTNYVVPPTRHAARVVTVHDLAVVLYPHLCDPATLAFPDLIRRAVAEGAWVHTPSQFIADQVVAELSIDPERVRSVYLGIPPPPPAEEREARLPMALPDGCRRYVLAVGTIEPRKDYPLLISAFDAVASAHPDVALVIVGRDGWGVEQVRATVEAAAARERIVRPGYLDDRGLDAVLRHASVLAYPSRYEGFGFPPLQAMSAGVPVVVTAAGAIPEVVGDGALVVDPGDGDGLAASIIRALAGGVAIDELIDRGRRRSATFTWDACAEGLVDLYRDAVRGHGTRRVEPTPRSGPGPGSGVEP
ncbi:MAG TPA: glycosyltransferase family 1 protein [Acidimicrobiales bacterium]|jgi:glycosyltransferase involved in cell wall biosynthesis|nr:glycosyltransferase family 1 protein [Acidimicrobiales bacterium]